MRTKHLFSHDSRRYLGDNTANASDSLDQSRELVAALPPGPYITITGQHGFRVYRLVQAELDPGETDPANMDRTRQTTDAALQGQIKRINASNRRAWASGGFRGG